MAKNGAYLCNCVKNGHKRSAIAYYKELKFGGGNIEEQPDDFIYLTSDGFKNWAGTRQILASGTVVTIANRTFTLAMNNNASQQLPAGTKVGQASYNGESMEIYKDNGARLMTALDGFECFKLFVCN